MRTSNAPQVAINDIGGPEEFLAAVDETIKYFNDGDIVTGTVVKVDHDEVLLDIGYKTCLLYTSPSPRDRTRSRMPSSA